MTFGALTTMALPARGLHAQLCCLLLAPSTAAGYLRNRLLDFVLALSARLEKDLRAEDKGVQEDRRKFVSAALLIGSETTTVGIETKEPTRWQADGG